jgi:glycosyltransferase involved in cell wall biosynthesis
MVHLREVFPTAKIIVFGEYFYLSQGGDFGFDPEFQESGLSAQLRLNAKNAVLALSYALADRIVCPTPFQASTFPEISQTRISILHEGLPLGRARRRPGAQLSLAGGRMLTSADSVITFVSRHLERTRGFHIFMRALPEVMAARPDAQVVVLGSPDGSGYAAPLPGGQTLKHKMLAELGDRLDLGRIHFLGSVAHQRMVDALSISRAHVYYTYPFVLSWSLIEAMACECLIVASDTPPVRDVVADGENGLLNDFFDVEALSRTLIQALDRPEDFEPMRARARSTVETRFDKDHVGVPSWLRLIDEVLES